WSSCRVPACVRVIRRSLSGWKRVDAHGRASKSSRTFPAPDPVREPGSRRVSRWYRRRGRRGPSPVRRG
ncbi:MAG: hypothetical protein AVDCRST_MAG87-2336, partial [uncultured Thermomicrobiales bacterium]